MQIVGYLNLADTEHKITEEPRYGRDALGYGRRIPTRYMVRLTDSRRWRRVYCCCYSNAGTCYVESNGGWLVVQA